MCYRTLLKSATRFSTSSSASSARSSASECFFSICNLSHCWCITASPSHLGKSLVEHLEVLLRFLEEHIAAHNLVVLLLDEGHA